MGQIKLYGHLYIRSVDVNVTDVIEDDTTEDDKRLAEKRRYMAVLNMEREKTDLAHLEKKMAIVKERMTEISDPNKMKKSLGNLRSLVKFWDHAITMNEKIS